MHRLVVVSAFGVGESRREAPPIPRFMYRLLLGEIFADVAHFIVKELESPAFVRKTVALAG